MGSRHGPMASEHDKCVRALWLEFRERGYHTMPEVYARRVGYADLLVAHNRGEEYWLSDYADAAIEVKTAVGVGVYSPTAACRQVLRYANGWRRPDGRIAVPVVVDASGLPRATAVEVCRRRGVRLIAGDDIGDAVDRIERMIAPVPCLEASA